MVRVRVEKKVNQFDWVKAEVNCLDGTWERRHIVCSRKAERDFQWQEKKQSIEFPHISINESSP